MTAPLAVPVGAADLHQALEFARDHFRRACHECSLTADEAEQLERYHQEQLARLDAGQPPDDCNLRPADVCWSCREPLTPDATACVGCGAAAHTADVARLRHLVFLCHEIKKHERAGRISLTAAHQALADANARIVALRRKLDGERVPLVVAVERPSAKPAEGPAQAPQPRRSFLEVLLDPRTIQWMLALGGALLVLGIVIYLAAEGLFKNPLFVAIVLGAGNAALLGAGFWLVLGTRYQTAGRALTLLACLLMPFNLWFYDAQGLLALRNGGHLWVAALVCVAAYAAAARVLRDPIFVPVLVAGVALAGFLLLAEDGKWFWQVAAPIVFLVGLGLVCIHVERAFPHGDGPFTRRRFGLAFFWSGHAVLAAGLLFLLGTQLLGGPLYLHYGVEVFHRFGGQPDVVTRLNGHLLALVLVLLGAYAYLYSDLFVRRLGVYAYLAVFNLLWAEVLLIGLIEWGIPTIEVVIAALSLTALAANFAIASLPKSDRLPRRLAAPLAFALAVLPVLLGVLAHVGAWLGLGMYAPWDYRLGASYVVVMVLAALCCRVAAYLNRRDERLTALYLFGSAAATLAALHGLLLLSNPKMGWDVQGPVLMLLPLAYLIAARLSRGHSQEKPLIRVAHAAAILLFVCSLAVAFAGFTLVRENRLNLALALFFVEAAVFYALETTWRGKEFAFHAATVMTCAAVWQLCQYFGVTEGVYVIAFAVVGLALLAGYRFALLENYRSAGVPRAVFRAGTVLLLLALAAGALLTLGRLHNQEKMSLTVPLPLVLALVGGLAAALTRHNDWRRFFVAAAVLHAVLTVLALAVLVDLTPAQKLEVVLVVAGLALLVVGHVGWLREGEGNDDLVTIALLIGSLLVLVPLVVTVVSLRAAGDVSGFHTLNEVVMLAVALLLLGSGFACRIKSTTLAGALMLAVYLVSLLLYVRLPEQLQTTAVYLIIGGGVFFGAGLLLSVYRDRLLALPGMIKRREGVFRILSWR
jgi:hypothetical protein